MRKLQESSKKIARSAFPLSAVPEGVGSVVEKERIRRRWSQAKLAVRAGLARASIYRLEKDGRASRADTLFRIAHALDMEIRELVPDWPEWDPVRGSGHGEAIREQRRSNELTLAAVLGVSESTLSRHERGIYASRRIVRRVGADIAYSSGRLTQVLAEERARHEEGRRSGTVEELSDPIGPFCPVEPEDLHAV